MSRLFDPKRGPNGKFHFEWRGPAATDVRATWDRMDPGWRERRVGESKPEPRVTDIRKKVSQR